MLSRAITTNKSAYGNKQELCEPVQLCPVGLLKCLNRVTDYFHNLTAPTARATRAQEGWRRDLWDVHTCLRRWHKQIPCGEWRFAMSLLTSVFKSHRPSGYAPERSHFYNSFGALLKSTVLKVHRSPWPHPTCGRAIRALYVALDLYRSWGHD